MQKRKKADSALHKGERESEIKGGREARAQINSPERRIIVFGFRRGGAELYEKLKGCQVSLKADRPTRVCAHARNKLHLFNVLP